MKNGYCYRASVNKFSDALDLKKKHKKNREELFNGIYRYTYHLSKDFHLKKKKVNNKSSARGVTSSK